MKRGLYLLPLILAILAINVLALDVTFTPVQDQVLPGQQAKYVLKITNNELARTDIIVKSIDLNWILDNDGAKLTLNAGESVDFNAVYTPLSSKIKPGKYGLNYRIESASKTIFNDFLPVQVVDYKDVLSADFAVNSVVDPRRNSILKLEITNLKPIDLVGLDVSIDSPQIKDSKTLNLVKNEKGVVEFQVAPNSNLQEGDYPLSLVIAMDGNKFVEKTVNVKISRYTDLQEVTEPTEGFLILGETSTLTNKGNNVLEESHKKKLSWVQSFFTSYSPEPNSVEDGKDGFKYAVWNYRLLPGETKVFSYKTNYLAPIFYTLLFILIVGGLYILRKKDLEVTKRVLTLHTTEGNLAIMKVLVTVKNTSSTSLNDVKIMDKVPGAIKAPVEFGMIKPTSVKNIGENTALVWELPHMKKGEEKVISYKIEGRVNILDTIILPSALAKIGQGTTKKMFSSKNVSLSKKH